MIVREGGAAYQWSNVNLEHRTTKALEGAMSVWDSHIPPQPPVIPWIEHQAQPWPPYRGTAGGLSMHAYSSASRDVT